MPSEHNAKPSASISDSVEICRAADWRLHSPAIGAQVLGPTIAHLTSACSLRYPLREIQHRKTPPRCIVEWGR